MGRRDVGYEPSDVRPGVVLAGLACLMFILVVVLIAVTLFDATVTRTPATIAIRAPGAAPAPTPPRLEAQPGEALQPYLAAQRRKLTTYRWVDRQAGVVAIPIDRAIDLIVQGGLPSRSAPAELGNRAPSVSSSGRVDEAYP